MHYSSHMHVFQTPAYEGTDCTGELGVDEGEVFSHTNNSVTYCENGTYSHPNTKLSHQPACWHPATTFPAATSSMGQHLGSPAWASHPGAGFRICPCQWWWMTNSDPGQIHFPGSLSAASLPWACCGGSLKEPSQSWSTMTWTFLDDRWSDIWLDISSTILSWFYLAYSRPHIHLVLV